MGALEGVRALVTGGARGIGAAICRELAADGASVAVNDLPESSHEATEVVSDVLASGVDACLALDDLSQAEACHRVVAAAADRLGGLDLLVNNAGGPFGHVAFEETTEAHFDKVLGVNLKAAFFCSQAAVPHLRSSDRARIVNLTSELFFVGHGLMAAYAASKGGIVGLTRSLALALAPAVRVNAVAPGPTTTARLMAEAWFREAGDDRLEGVPLHRWGDPQDVARAVTFLGGPGGDWITGQVLNVNGGIVMP
jgi:glucose 1-dehydrogenase